MASPISTYKPEYCDIAIQVLSGGESLAAVCCEIGISRPTLYLWRDNNPEFAEALNFGLQKAQRQWERMGREGIEGQIDKFGGTPFIFMMKNRFREDYADQKEDTSHNTLIEKLIDKL